MATGTGDQRGGKIGSDLIDANTDTDEQAYDATREIRLGTREGSIFDLVRRGYDRTQVEERLAQWAAALSAAEQQRDSALAGLKQAKAAAAQSNPAELISDRLRQILRLAEEEADQVRADARAELAGAVGQARAEATAIRQQAQDEAEQLLAEVHEQAEQEREAAAVDRAEGAEQREDQVNWGHAEADRLVAAATAQAERLIAAGHAEAEELTAWTEQRRDEALAEHQRSLAEQREEHAVQRSRLEAEIAELQQRRDATREEIARLRDALAASVGSLGQPPAG